MEALKGSVEARKIKLPLIFLCLFFLWCTSSMESSAKGRERIIDFNSHITVNRDSAMKVVETITVQSNSEEIKRGIYRDFPTRYKDSLGNHYVVGFEVESVTRDGRPEEYKIKNLSNGKRVYIGSEDHYLNPGIYTYTITYKTDSQLGFFETHDELYWNVTGNGWIFPIERASATVILPEGVPSNEIHVEGYTGLMGSKARDLTSYVSPDGKAEFETTKPLNPHEGMTIVVTWPKGYVMEPTASQKALRFYRDNFRLITGFVGLIVLSLYYIVAWLFVGRDPRKETIIPLYLPPDNMSPASMRFIKEMGYDNKIFASTIINMAVKGYLSIKEEDGKYTLVRGDRDESVLDSDEKAIAAALGFNRRKQLELSNKNHAVISKAINALMNSLKSAWEGRYFKNNRAFFWIGLCITAAVIISIVVLDPSGDSFELLWSSAWGIAVAVMLTQVIKSWRMAARGKSKNQKISAILLTLFSTPFILVFIVITLLSGLYNLAIFLVIAAMLTINIVFFKLLKAHTLEGRRVVDKIEGFKMYLTVAEKDKLNLMNPSERTPELFERYLPYALALDVEQQWAEQFADILATANQDGTYYRPRWYSGVLWDMHHVGTFTETLGSSFSQAISSSSTPPGSSSGSGGGGSSGGGGGGGGGGGW